MALMLSIEEIALCAEVLAHPRLHQRGTISQLSVKLGVGRKVIRNLRDKKGLRYQNYMKAKVYSERVLDTIYVYENGLQHA